MNPDSESGWLDTGFAKDTRILDSVAGSLKDVSRRGVDDFKLIWGSPSAASRNKSAAETLREAGAKVDPRFGRTLYREGGAVELMTPYLRSLWAAVGMALPPGQEELVDEWTRSVGFRNHEDLVLIIGGRCVVTRLWPRALLTMPSGKVESRQVRVVLEAYVPSGRNLRLALETRALRTVPGTGGAGQWNQLHAKNFPTPGDARVVAGALVGLAMDWSELLDLPLTGEVDKW